MPSGMQVLSLALGVIESAYECWSLFHADTPSGHPRITSLPADQPASGICAQVLVASLQELAKQLKENGFSALNVSVV